MKTRNIFALLLGLGLLLATFVRSAAHGRPAGQADPQSPPREAALGMVITYQGRLTDKNGVPLNKPVNVVFKLYDTSDFLMWTSATRTITPVNGLFTVYLGEPPDPRMFASFYKSIGVTVGSDPEMSPRQPFNSLVAYNENQSAVLGSSTNKIGVMGLSVNDIGIFGSSTNGTAVTGESDFSTGVYAVSDSISAPALVANSLRDGPAINLYGGIEVASAGVDTTTPVFLHRVTISNTCPAPDSDHITVITNPMTDGRPGAILLVTPNYRSSDASQSNYLGPAKDIPAVSYMVDGRCGTANNNKWVIYNLNSSPMVINTYYNVMVIWP